jgi:thioredoxin-dependent peroxiredoxin
MTELQIGTKAPDFSLPAVGGDTVSLAQFAGRKLVLFFYPKDNTEGCTLEARDFSRLKADFEKQGAVVIGMSPDSVKKHENFTKKHDLTVPLAADEDMAILSAYGVWQEKSMYGRTYMGVVRTTFLIGEDGTILNIWPKVKVAGHADAVLEAVKAAKA